MRPTQRRKVLGRTGAWTTAQGGGTYKGFVNPLRHYNESDGSLRFVLQLDDSETTEELALAVQVGLSAREQAGEAHGRGPFGPLGLAARPRLRHGGARPSRLGVPGPSRELYQALRRFHSLR
eukprot:g1903.t1